MNRNRQRAIGRVVVGLVVVVVLGVPVGAGPVAAVGGGVFVVNSAADPGSGGCDAVECTLREAIEAVNANGAVADTISFAVPGPVPVTIRPVSELPEVHSGVLIDGWSQPGFVGTPVVELDGSLAGVASGLVFKDSGCHDCSRTVRGLVINRFAVNGIWDDTIGEPLVVEGCYVGTDVSGAVGLGNGLNGLLSTDFGSSTGLLVRDSVLSGNGGWGLREFNDHLTAVASRVGTDVTGTMAIPNQRGGVYGYLLHSLAVGGTGPGDANVISGNHGPGLSIEQGTFDGYVAGNRIGTDLSGTRPLANTGPGVRLLFVGNVFSLVVGGGAPGAGNVIVANGGPGIYAVGIDGRFAPLRFLGNAVGTDLSGRLDLGNGGAGISLAGADLVVVGGAGHEANLIGHNAGPGLALAANGSDQTSDVEVSHNRWSGNAGLAVDLDGDGPTANDPGDADEGPDHLQNHPVLDAAVAVGGRLAVTGTLDTSPQASVHVYLYGAKGCGPFGRGEATRWLGARTLTTDAAGHAKLDRSFAAVVPAGWVAFATATAGLNTSEFSPCLTVEAGATTSAF